MASKGTPGRGGPYELVLCDLGGVVVEVESDRLVHHAAQAMGRSFEEVHATVFHEELLLPFELGNISARQYYEGLTKRLHLPWTYEQFARVWNDIFREQPGMVPVMQRLRARHTVIALTNTNELHLGHIKANFPQLTAVFTDWVASCEVGCRKPDPKIYELALKRAKKAAKHAIYIDDRPELVEAGRAVGLTAIRFESAAQLQEELLRVGVEW